MRADPRFLDLPKHFWANVRSISQVIGYTVRGRGEVRVPSIAEMRFAMTKLDLGTKHLEHAAGKPTEFARTLSDYFQHRADVLNGFVKPRLMNGGEAKKMFAELRKNLRPTCPLPMNKQKRKKKAYAFFTCIINMLIEANAGGHRCDFDPRQLTTVTSDGAPLRTMARRVDGAFPAPVNPIAIWEIKEYYYTTSFGSRVADGVYETLLDGMEIEELRRSEGYDLKHYLMVDARFTWWECGRSYLCRIVDMLHMGYIDEVLFGREVAERLPQLVSEWVGIAERRR